MALNTVMERDSKNLTPTIDKEPNKKSLAVFANDLSIFIL